MTWQTVNLRVPESRYRPFMLDILPGAMLAAAGPRRFFDRKGYVNSYSIALHTQGDVDELLGITRRAVEAWMPNADQAIGVREMQIDQDIAEVLIGEDACALYTDHSVTSMTNILDWLQLLEVGGTTKLSVAFDLMSLHILNARMRATYRDTEPGAFPMSYLSFRAHADGFMAATGKEQAVRRDMDARYQAANGRYMQRFLRLRNLPEIDRPVHLSRWTQLTEPTHKRIGEGVASGRLGYRKAVYAPSMHVNVEFTPDNILHGLESDPDVVAFMVDDKEMETGRLATSLLYLTLNRFGINRVERCYLCHIICRSIEDGYSMSMEDAKNRLKSALAGH